MSIKFEVNMTDKIMYDLRLWEQCFYFQLRLH